MLSMSLPYHRQLHPDEVPVPDRGLPGVREAQSEGPDPLQRPPVDLLRVVPALPGLFNDHR